MKKFQTPQEIDAYLRTIPKERIVAKEIKHGTYTTHSEEGVFDDAIVAKMWVTLDNGERYPTIVIPENYERPFWITKPDFRRNQPEKIQFEFLHRLDKFKATQRNLRREICSKLGYGSPGLPLRQIARSQYLYGTDPGPEVFLKQAYMDRWPTAFQPNAVSVIDVETDVNGLLDPVKQLPILWSEVNDDEVIVYVNEQWSYDVPNYEELLREDYNAIIPQWVDGLRNKVKDKETGEYPDWVDSILRMKFTVRMLPSQYHITDSMLQHLHMTQPDIVTGWNVFFDFKRAAESIEHAGRNVSQAFSDPRVPMHYQRLTFREGPQSKLTSSGKSMRLDPQEQWHVVLSTSSFRILDSMQIYWQLRKAKGKESGGYGLGAVLDRQLSIGKLHHATEDSSIPEGTLHWHMEMQLKYKVRYGSYNAVDSIGVWVLNKKNDDLSSQISTLAGSLDYSNFNSQPKINSTDMLFSVMKKSKRVICSTSDQMKTKLDEKLIGRDGWIVTFPSHNVESTGLFLFEDMPEVQSMLHMFNADADVETTYPIAGIIQNVAKETTLVEPCRIQGVPPSVQRLISVNMSGGRVNAIEIMQATCKIPALDLWVEEARKDFAKAA